MHRVLLFFYCLFCIQLASSQDNRASVWHFGKKAGLTFTTTSVVAKTDGALSSKEGCATISNDQGQLLFYTQGDTIWNAAHQVMLNGGGLAGDDDATNSSLIVPHPEQNNTYFVFTVRSDGVLNSLHYSEVDMNLDNGNGAVVVKDSSLNLSINEKITAIQKPDSNDVWVITSSSNLNQGDEKVFYSHKITELGVNTIPVSSEVPNTAYVSNQNASVGAMKISPDGTKLALANNGENNVEVYSFNIKTGKVDSLITTIDGHASSSCSGGTGNNAPYGIEFSPNSKLLYTSDFNGFVFQYKLDTINIAASEHAFTDACGSKALQLGIDGKIYIAKNNAMALDAIENPNSFKDNAIYTQNFIHLGGDIFGGPRSKFGLPQFVQSYFLPPVDLLINKSVDNKTPSELDTIKFTITVSNNSLSLVNNLVVSDQLPDGLTFLSATPSVGTWSSPNWNIGGLAAGTQASIEIEVQVDDGTAGATIINIATHTQDQFDVNTSTDSPSDTINVTNVDLALIKTVDNFTPVIGDSVTFTLSVLNEGITTATEVKIKDSLPDGYTYAADNGNGTYDPVSSIWSIDLIEPDSTKVLDIQVIVNDEGEYLNVAEIIAVREGDSDSEPNNNILEEDDQDTASTEPIEELLYPGIITPNDDGLNDEFRIEGLDKQCPEFTIEIFNRWGASLYLYDFSTDPDQIPDWWDGFYNGNGKRVPVGTYYYIVFCNDGKREPKTGHFYLNK